MFSHNGKISTRQVIILLVLQMLNTTILIQPKLSARYMGRNGYILPLLAIILGIIYAWCISGLMKQFPGDSFVEILPQIMPDIVARIILIIFVIQILVGTGLELRMFSEVISFAMLPKTPLSIIMLTMLFAVVYLVKSGIEAIGRMGEIVSYLVIAAFLLVFITIGLNADYRELRPFLEEEMNNVGVGVYFTSLTFLPIEVMLMLGGLMNEPKKISRTTIISIAIIGVIEGGITILTYSGIGVVEAERQIWPVLTLMQSIQSLGTVLANQEIFIMTGWIFSNFIYLSLGIYIVSLIGSRSCIFKRENIFVLPLVPIVFFIAILPDSLIQVYRYYISFFEYLGVWFLGPVPLILLLIAKARRTRGEVG